MSDAPKHTCKSCGHSMSSKFALKRHLALCQPYGYTQGRAPVERKPRQRFVVG